MFKSINPANLEVIKTYNQMTIDEYSRIIIASDNHQKEWKETDFSHRKKLLKNAAEILLERKKELSHLMTIEMGKPIVQSRAEIDKCAWVCDYYADNGEKFLSDEIISTDAEKSFVSYQPLGIVLAIMPWNFPFWQVLRFAAPALMAGNSCILKHSPNVFGCAIEIEKIFVDAGFPENLFKSLIIPVDDVVKIINNPLIKAVTFTGSTAAGKAIASQAGAVLKKTVLELGGSDPYVILEDADIEKAVVACVNSRLLNTGQSCIAAKRFIIVESVYDKFETLFVDLMQSKKYGNPLKEEIDLGTIAREDLREKLHNQVLQSINKGAKLLIGGWIPDIEGWYYPPTVLANVKKGMPAYEEELFGPVAALIKVKDTSEALTVANDTVYGLGAAIFTSDKIKGEELAKKYLDAGCCFVNDFVKSDPRLPFGGIKESGYGRELSLFGIREFVNIKSIFIK